MQVGGSLDTQQLPPSWTPPGGSRFPFSVHGHGGFLFLAAFVSPRGCGNWTTNVWSRRQFLSGVFVCNPKQWTFIREFPQNYLYIEFVLFDPPPKKMWFNEPWLFKTFSREKPPKLVGGFQPTTTSTRKAVTGPTNLLVQSLLIGGSSHLKNMLVKLDHFPRDPGWKFQKYLKPPRRKSLAMTSNLKEFLS